MDINKVFYWMNESKERTFVLSQAVYQGSPSWVCMLRGKEVSIIVYEKTPEDAIERALEKAANTNK